MAVLLARLYSRPFLGYPAPPRPLRLVFIPRHQQPALLGGGTLIGGDGRHIHKTTSHSSRGPESFTSATQPDFVDAIPISVHVSAGEVAIEFWGVRVMFKDFVPTAGHDDSAASLVPSLGLPSHCGISSVRQRSEPQFGLSGRVHAPLRLPRSLRNVPQGIYLPRRKRSAPFIGLSGRIHAPLRHPRFLRMYPKVLTHSGAIPELACAGHVRHAARLLAPAWGSVGLDRVSRK